MSRVTTLAGYAVIAGALALLAVVSRRTRRIPRFAESLRVWMRPVAGRWIMSVAWLWLGWHVFVRADWR